jgi:hypothetical protein
MAEKREESPKPDRTEKPVRKQGDRGSHDPDRANPAPSKKLEKAAN